MLVRAQAASNWREGLQERKQKLTLLSDNLLSSIISLFCISPVQLRHYFDLSLRVCFVVMVQYHKYTTTSN